MLKKQLLVFFISFLYMQFVFTHEHRDIAYLSKFLISTTANIDEQLQKYVLEFESLDDDFYLSKNQLSRLVPLMTEFIESKKGGKLSAIMCEVTNMEQADRLKAHRNCFRIKAIPHLEFSLHDLGF